MVSPCFLLVNLCFTPRYFVQQINCNLSYSIQFVLPLHIRMPFRHLVSFFWTAYVRFTRGAIGEDPSEDVEANAGVVVEEVEAEQ